MSRNNVNKRCTREEEGNASDGKKRAPMKEAASYLHDGPRLRFLFLSSFSLKVLAARRM